MDQNTEKAFDEIEKALRPEITKEQLGMVIEHLMEAIESMIEVPEEEEDSESEDVEVEDGNPAPIGDPEKNDINWPVAKVDGQTDLEAENENETYKSDNQDEDKWDNEMQKCWSGYTQRGMKEKGGRMVPNCVPVEKAEDASEIDQVTKSIWSGAFTKRKSI